MTQAERAYADPDYLIQIMLAQGNGACVQCTVHCATRRSMSGVFVFWGGSVALCCAAVGKERAMLATVDWGLYVLTDRDLAGGRALPDIIRQAVAGGASVVQLRDKHASSREMYALGRELLTITRVAGVPLIVNDRVDIALAINADGVHVGQDDLPAAIVREIIGTQRLLGVSAETVEQAQAAAAAGADYLGVGTVYPTGTKPDANAPIGVAGVAQIVQATNLPCVAIGGITAANTAPLLAVGVQGVAVVSAIIAADDPAAAAREFRTVIAQYRKE